MAHIAQPHVAASTRAQKRSYHRLVAALTVVVLALVSLNVLGIDVLPQFGGGPTVPSLRASNLQQIVHLTPTAASGQPPFLARAPDGSLVVSDRVKRRILRFDLDGNLLSEWGPTLSPAVELSEPAGVAATASAWFVLDRAQPLIVRLDRSGAVQGLIDLRPFNLYGPNGLAADADGTTYVADTGGSRVLVFAADGQLSGTLGTPGSEVGQLKQPISMAIAPDGGLYVADWENSRIESWSPDKSTRAISTGYRPWSVDVDELGRIYSVNPDSQTVDVFAPGGQRLTQLNISSQDSHLEFPSQLALSSDGSQLFVLGHDGLLRMSLEGVAPEPTQSGGTGWLVAELPGVVVGIIIGVLLGLMLPRRRLAAALAGLGGYPWATGARGATEVVSFVRPLKLEYVALGGLLFVMLVTRLVSLGTLPDTLNPDEADNIQSALRILYGSPPENGFFGFDWYGEPALSAYVFALFMKLFGVSQFAARLPTALISVAALGLFYVLLRRQLSVPASLIATLLLGSQLWYVHLSRMAWNNLHVTLFTLGAMLSLLMALDNLALKRFGRAVAWTVVCGVWGALTLYGYPAGRLVLPSLFAILPIAIVRNRKDYKLILGSFVAVGAIAVLLFLPQALYILTHWDAFARRLADVSLLNKPEFQLSPLSVLGYQLAANFLGFWLGPFNNMPSHFPPGEPLLDTVTGLLVLAGMVASLIVPSFRGRLETWLWWSVFVIGWFFTEVITERTPDGARGIGWMPALLFFAAISIELVLRSVDRQRLPTDGPGRLAPSWYRPAAVAAVSIVAVVVATRDFSHYVDWSNLPETRRMRDPFIAEAEFPSWSAAVVDHAERHQASFNVGDWRVSHPLNADIPALAS